MGKAAMMQLPQALPDIVLPSLTMQNKRAGSVGTFGKQQQTRPQGIIPP
jgi:hypothetical protein